MFFKFKLQDFHLLYLLTKLPSSWQSSTPKPGLQQHPGRGPHRHPPEPRGRRTPPRPGPYPHPEGQPGPLKSLHPKSRAPKPQTAPRRSRHRLSRTRFHPWLSEQPRTDQTTTKCHRVYLTGSRKMPLLESGRTKSLESLNCSQMSFVYKLY